MVFNSSLKPGPRLSPGRRRNIAASRLALLFVLIVVGGVFLWWARHRPSYLLYQASREIGEGNQAAVIAEYQRLLRKKNLSTDDEIRMRKALGTFYVRAFQDSNGISLVLDDSDKVENPYLELAKREFDRVTALNPKDAEAHYYLGRILWFRHLEAFAMEEINRSREYDPRNPEPLWFLAWAHLERGNASSAREAALQALAIRSDYDEARLALAEAYAQLGDPAGAIEQFNRLSPSFRSNPDTLASHALFLARQNEWAEADRAIAEAERLAPGNGRVKLLAGRILLEKNELEEAGGKFAQSGALMPRNVWPVVWQAIASGRRGLCEESSRAGQFVAERLPRWGWGHVAAAAAALCRDDAERALSSLDEALRLSPELQEATELKAEILMDRRRFYDLGLLARPLLDKKQHESFAYRLLAESFYHQKNYLMARDMAESAIKSNQQSAFAYVWLAKAREALNDPAGARRAMDNARGLRPFDSRLR